MNASVISEFELMVKGIDLQVVGTTSSSEKKGNFVAVRILDE